MVSRALSLATVTLLIGCFTADVVAAQNLDAGKSPSQIFSSTCSACHRSPRGLLKTTPASSLPGFLRQHYTTGSDMASVLSSYLISNGAADPRYQGKDQAKQSRQKDARQEARPDAEGRTPQGERTRPGRDGKRLSRRHAEPEANPAEEGQSPVPAATDSKFRGRQKQGRRGRPVVEEPPKNEQVTHGDAAKGDSSQEATRPEAAKPEAAKPEAAGSEPGRVGTVTGDPATARVDAPRESAGSETNPLRPDTISPVTPAPPASATSAPEPSSASTPAAPPPVTATAPEAPAAPPTPPGSH